MIDNTNTKKEIITEILALAKYLKKNQLFNMNRSASSLDQDNKQELIDLHRRMVVVISGDIIKRGKKGEVPELKELADEYKAKLNELHDGFITSRDNYLKNIENMVREWLGYDLIIRVSETNIELRMSKESLINISIHYREHWDDKNPGVNHDAVRFFQVMNTIISDPDWQHLDIIRDWMDKLYSNSVQWYRGADKLEDEYHDKAAVIAGEMVLKNYNEYIK